jgi:hypothetical protein
VQREVTIDPPDGTAATVESGVTLFTDVPEFGSVKILLTGASCSLGYAWAGIEDGTFRANVVAGRLFSTTIVCP